MALNRFGAVFGSVISLYPGTQESDFGSQAIIEEALDRASDVIANACSPEIYGQLTETTLQVIVRRATAGQTTGTTWIKPLVAGETHIWVGQPSQFTIKPVLSTDPNTGMSDSWAGSSSPAVEIDSTAFSVNTTTGVITLTVPMSANDMMLGSFRVDSSSGSYSVPSLARLAVRGAAAEMGHRLYTEANQEWALVAAYQKEFDDAIESLLKGNMVPSEMRAALFWNEPEPATGMAGTVRLYRG